MKRGLLLAGIVGVFCVAGTASGQQASNAAGTASVQPTLQSLAAENARLMQEVSSLQQITTDLQKTIDDLSRTIREMPSGSTIGRGIRSQMVDPALREEFNSVVQGRLNLNNFTGRYVVIHINGTPWTVIPNKSFIWVPVGMTTVKLPNEPYPRFIEAGNWGWNEREQVSEASFDVLR